jgi:hypothetical protein
MRNHARPPPRAPRRHSQPLTSLSVIGTSVTI